MARYFASLRPANAYVPFGRSENMELLELNNHYRSLIKKAREKKAAGSGEVLTGRWQSLAT